MSGERFVVRASRWKAGLAAILAGAVLVRELVDRDSIHAFALPVRAQALVTVDGMHAIAVFCAGLVFLGASLRVLDRRDRIRIDSEGLLALEHSPDVIRWDAIESAWPLGVNALCLKLTDPERHQAHGWRRLFAAKPPRGVDLVLTLDHAEDQFGDMLDAVERYRPGLIRNL